jgi:hypothetical protein
MKTIVITDNQNNFSKYSNLLSKYIVELEFQYVDSVEKLISLNNANDTVAFFMLDALLPSEIFNSALKAIIDIAQDRAIVTCGEKGQLEKVDKNLFIKSDNNIIIQDIHDLDKIEKVISFIKGKKSKLSEEETLAESKIQFIPIKLRNLYYTDQLPNNLYIKATNSKYILALEKNTPIAHMQVAKLVKRKINFLYIEKDKHLSFLELSMLKATKFLETNVGMNKKVLMAHLRSTAIIQDYIYNAGVTPSLEFFIDALLDNMIASLEKATFYQKVLDTFTINFECNVGKSVLCAYTSFFVIQDLSWRSVPIRKKFLLASLIQDTFLDNDDLSKLKSMNDPNVVNFTEDEIKSFNTHTEKIATTALQLSRFPDLDFILRQHHETATRDGFPNRPSPAELQLAVCTFNLCSRFSLDLNKVEISEKNIGSIYKELLKESNVGNFKLPMASLRKILKL